MDFAEMMKADRTKRMGKDEKDPKEDMDTGLEEGGGDDLPSDEKIKSDLESVIGAAEDGPKEGDAPEGEGGEDAQPLVDRLGVSPEKASKLLKAAKGVRTVAALQAAELAEKLATDVRTRVKVEQAVMRMDEDGDPEGGDEMISMGSGQEMKGGKDDPSFVVGGTGY